jgi:hypothetical protein
MQAAAVVLVGLVAVAGLLLVAAPVGLVVGEAGTTGVVGTATSGAFATTSRRLRIHLLPLALPLL